MPMKILPLIGAMILLPVMPGSAQVRRGDQDTAYRLRRDGAMMSLREIESGIVPEQKRRGADYIGAELDSISGRYRLKFVRDGSVIWIDVDGRTGTVLARAGD